MNLFKFYCFSMQLLYLFSFISLTSYIYGKPAEYSQDFFHQLKLERAQRIAKVRESIDFNNVPEWKTTVTQTDSYIVVKRQTATIYFNRKTAVVDKTEILDKQFDKDCEIGSLELIDSNGIVYKQKWCKDGCLQLRNEKFYLYLEGQYTPVSKKGISSGLTCRVQYKLYKTSGLITVRTEVIKSKQGHLFKEARFISTLGATDQPLDILNSQAYANYHYVKTLVYKPTKGRQVLYNDKHHSVLWTDGRIGFEVLPMYKTWDQMQIDDSADGDKYITAAGKGKKRYANCTFLNKGKGQAIESGTKMHFSFALLPFRRFDGKYYLAQGSLAPLLSYDSDKPLDSYNKIYLRRELGRGTSYLHAVGMESRIFFFPNQEKWFQLWDKFIDAAHEYGLKVWWTMSWSRFEVEPLIKSGYLTEEDAVEMLKISKDPNLDTNRGVVDFTTESKRFREGILDSITMGLRDFNCDGVYFDLGTLFVLRRDWATQIEGNVILMEDVKLLLKSFGPDKKVQYHAQLEVSPLEGMVDLTTPGETITGAGYTELPRAMYESVYNSHLLGTSVLLYDNHSYNLEKEDIYKQAYRNCLSYSGALLVKGHDFPISKDVGYYFQKESDNLERYFSPFNIFKVNEAKFYSFNDPDFKKYASVKYKGQKQEKKYLGAYANLYVRNDQCLVTIANDPGCSGSASIAIDLGQLGIAAGRAVVMDVINKDNVVVHRVNANKVAIKNIDLTKEPRVFIIAAVDDQPRILWRDIEMVDCSLEVLPMVGWPYERFKIVSHVINTGEFDKVEMWIYTGKYGRPTLNNWTAIGIDQWFEEGKTAKAVFKTSVFDAENDSSFLNGTVSELHFLEHE